jgi:hypothetical protein
MGISYYCDICKKTLNNVTMSHIEIKDPYDDMSISKKIGICYTCYSIIMSATVEAYNNLITKNNKKEN